MDAGKWNGGISGAGDNVIMELMFLVITMLESLLLVNATLESVVMVNATLESMVF